MHETNVFRNSWNRVSKLLLHWNSKFQQSNSQYFVFTHLFEQYVIILWKSYNVRIETVVNFNCNQIRRMRMIVAFDSDCISLKKRRNAKLNSILTQLNNSVAKISSTWENFFAKMTKFQTSSILSTTTTIITRQLQIIYDMSKLTIIYMYFSYEKIIHTTTCRSNNRIFAISQQHQIVSSFFNHFQCLSSGLDRACLVYLIWLNVIRPKTKIIS